MKITQEYIHKRKSYERFAYNMTKRAMCGQRCVFIAQTQENKDLMFELIQNLANHNNVKIDKKDITNNKRQIIYPVGEIIIIIPQKNRTNIPTDNFVICEDTFEN